MTPAQYLAIGRDLALLVGIAIIVWLVWRGGSDHVKAGELRDLQTQIQHQGQINEQWHQETLTAQRQYSRDMAAIHEMAAVPTQHQWVCDAPRSKPVLPKASRKAPDEHPPAGSVQPGDGAAPTGDRRDIAIAAFKVRWEAVIAQCRAEDASWPQ